MDDLLAEFLTETSENLAVIDVELVKFEQDPGNDAILGNIFRLVHTIKGTCGFLGLPRLEAIAHAGETVLGKFRAGELPVTPQAVTLILQCIDGIRDLLQELEATGNEPDGDDQQIIDALLAMAEGDATGASPDTPQPQAPDVADAAAGGPALNEFGAPVARELLDEVWEAQSAGLTEANEALANDAGEAAPTPPTNRFGAPVAQELLDELEPAPVAVGDAMPAAPLVAEANAFELAEKPTVPAAVEQPTAAANPVEKAGAGETSIAQSSIRVHVDVLEDLMTLVSELVLTRNQLLQMVRGLGDSEFTAPLQRLSHITTDLQEGVMKTRMQPIGNAWSKLPRIVRDLSVFTGKQIELVMRGADTELDRQVLELIKDPLTHMVRNSADHGLEMPDERAALGKPEKGTIILDAFHEGGFIIIQISDDGKGLNMDRIRQKCLDNGLVTESDLAIISDHQIQQFIFTAGFSTAEKVTSVSGRGVGMDVVRANIEKFGGTVELKSVEGRGTTVTIKIPLTLAIVSALIVESCGQRFAVPQISVLELVRASANSDHAIEMINESPVLRLRNRLLPLISLQALLDLQSAPARLAPAAHSYRSGAGRDEHFVVVMQVGNNTFGIIVDHVFDTEEIVVKPVAGMLRHIPFYSGNTILGDGSVIMILDPNGVAEAVGQTDTPDIIADNGRGAGFDGLEEKTAFLVFKAGGKELKAVPLALVARLEDIDMATTETAHGQVMVQYRGQLMPLIPVDPEHQFSTRGRQPILVFMDRDRVMGLVVDEIVDIIEERLKIELATDVAGLVGSAILAGKATDIIDAGYYLTRAFTDWFGKADMPAGTALESGRRALLVDDSPFFRNLLSPLLSVAGWDVITADSADAALQMRDRGAIFDVIISDIEMPGMDGFQFSEAVRGDNRWRKTPMVALSGSASESDISKGKAVGFDDYVAKFDRQALVASLAHTVTSVASGQE